MFFFKNIAARIKLLAMILAILLFVGCLFGAVAFLVAALRTNDPLLREAGIQGTIVLALLALLLPSLCLVLYGFGELLKNSEKQTDTLREVKELLHHALADGVLADELSRKIAAVMPRTATAEPQRPAATAIAQVRVTAPAPKKEESAPEQAPAAAVPVIDESEPMQEGDEGRVKPLRNERQTSQF